LNEKLQEREVFPRTNIDRIVGQLRQLHTRITEEQVMGTKFMIVSRIRMVEAIEDQLRILQDKSSTTLEIERAELRAELLIRITVERE
jgi:hypothetical protein